MSGSQLLVSLGDIGSRGVKIIQRETGKVSDKRKVNGSIESRVRRVHIYFLNFNCISYIFYSSALHSVII